MYLKTSKRTSYLGSCPCFKGTSVSLGRAFGLPGLGFRVFGFGDVSGRLRLAGQCA